MYVVGCLGCLVRKKIQGLKKAFEKPMDVEDSKTEVGWDVDFGEERRKERVAFQNGNKIDFF